MMPPAPTTSLPVMGTMVRHRWRYTLLTILALGFYLWGGIEQRDLAHTPDSFDATELAYPVQIVGSPRDAVAGSVEELESLLQPFHPGDTVTLRPALGLTRHVTLEAAFSPLYPVVTLVNGLFFWFVSLLVFAPRIDKVPAFDLYWACLLYGLAVMIGGVFVPRLPLWPHAVPPLLRVLSLVLLPTLMLHAGLTFPQRAAILDRHPRLIQWIYGLGLVLAVWQSVTLVRWWLAPRPELYQFTLLPQQLGKIFLALVFAGGVVGFFVGNARAHRTAEKEQTKWVLWGITFGAVPYIFLHALPPALGQAPLIPIEVARLFSVVIPLAFSFAVVRYQFLDVDIIIRRSIIYPLLASVMVGIYVLLGVFLGHRFEARFPGAEPYVPIVATLVPALLFHPTRRLLAVLIDRLFFKIQYNYAQALANFRLELRNARNQQDLAEALHLFLDQNLSPKKLGVVLRYDEADFCAGSVDHEVLRKLARELQPPVVGPPRTSAWPNTTGVPEIERADFAPTARDAGLVLVQPVFAGNRVLGWTAMAEKGSERRYIGQDLELLGSAAHETASVLQRMNLEKDVLKEAVARNRMEEMNRFRTDFFAQVAHDLRSPLTSISWSARNLLDGVVGDVSERQRDYLDGIESSARQLVRLVNNLLEITRMESGADELEMGPVALASVLETSVAKLSPTAAAKSVTLELTATNGQPEVRAHEEKLLEVADNLLENAVRYAPPHSTVTVELLADATQPGFAVHDRGPGIAAEDFDKLFEPYRQGRSSPWSTQQGFGLGLYVVRNWVERMGGKVQASNDPAGGARFTVQLRPAGSENPEAEPESNEEETSA